MKVKDEAVQIFSYVHMIKVINFPLNSIWFVFYSNNIGKLRLCLFFVKCAVVCWEILFPVSCFFFYTTDQFLCVRTTRDWLQWVEAVCVIVNWRGRETTPHTSTSCTVHNVRSSGGTAMETNQHKYHFMPPGVFKWRF